MWARQRPDQALAANSLNPELVCALRQFLFFSAAQPHCAFQWDVLFFILLHLHVLLIIK